MTYVLLIINKLCIILSLSLPVIGLQLTNRLLNEYVRMMRRLTLS